MIEFGLLCLVYLLGSLQEDHYLERRNGEEDFCDVDWFGAVNDSRSLCLR